MSAKTGVGTAEEAKLEGNEAFKAGDYPKAILCYTKAIELDGSNTTFWSNRSSAKLKQGDLQGALEDAEECIRLDSTYMKGYARKGAALDGMKDYEACQMAYMQGVMNCKNKDDQKIMEQKVKEVKKKILSTGGKSSSQRAVKLDTRDICALMDELEFDLFIHRGWGWCFDDRQTIRDAWTDSIDDFPTPWEDFMQGKRVVAEIVLPYEDEDGSMVKTNTMEEFRTFWKDVFESAERKEFRPFLFPNMCYGRTFRCTQRALRHFGKSIEKDFGIGGTINPPQFLAAIEKLANRNDSMLIVGCKRFNDATKPKAGVAILVDCLPLLMCSFCGKKEETTGGNQVACCSACHSTFYCNRDCQKKHWQQHKKECQEKNSKVVVAWGEQSQGSFEYLGSS